MRFRGSACSTWRRLTVASCCFALFLAATVAATPQRNAVAEYDLKAAYLYNFLKFVEWPTSVLATLDGQLRICVWGSHPVADVLATSGRTSVGDLEVVVDAIQDADHIDGCQVLFVPASSLAAPEAGERAKGKGILTVTEFDERDAEVGIINLWRRGGRVVFSIDLEAAESEGLRISSRLLEVAVERTEAWDGVR